MEGATFVNSPSTARNCELPHPTALGLTQPSLVEGGASCFCVGTCRNRPHSGSRLRRRFPFTGGSECPTPTELTLGHNRRCTLFVAFEQRRKRGEHLTTLFDCRGSKDADSHENKTCGRCIPSLLASLAEEGGLAPSITAKPTHPEPPATEGETRTLEIEDIGEQGDGIAVSNVDT